MHQMLIKDEYPCHSKTWCLVSVSKNWIQKQNNLKTIMTSIDLDSTNTFNGYYIKLVS